MGPDTHQWVIRASAQEFESKLLERTRLAPGSNLALEGVASNELHVQALDLQSAVRRFAAAVAEAMDESSKAGAFVDVLDLQAIERDHDWRGVFSALQHQAEGYEQHKLIAVRKYLQFLRTRRDLLEYVLNERAGLEETSRFDESTEPSAATLAKLRRIPIGDTVIAQLPDRGTLPMRLGTHAFGISGYDAPRLVDQNGRAQPLRLGRQTIGRHPECDILVDDDLADVSRLHVSIEWLGDGRLQITDLSSRGTFIDSSALCDE